MLRRIGSRNVALKCLNRLLLTGDYPFHQISDGDNTNDRIIMNDRQMAEIVLGHESHAFVYCVLGADGDDGASVGTPLCRRRTGASRFRAC